MTTGSVDLSFTADNKVVELYFDGKRVPVEDAEWTRVRKVAMPKRTRTIAFKCLDTGVSDNSASSQFQRPHCTEASCSLKYEWCQYQKWPNNSATWLLLVVPSTL